jgi:hypothetical protein
MPGFLWGKRLARVANKRLNPTNLDPTNPNPTNLEMDCSTQSGRNPGLNPDGTPR